MPERRIYAIRIEKVELSKPEEVECIWCGKTYNKNREYSERGHCPECGGTVTTDMGFPKRLVGKTYDIYRNPYFNPEKVKNRNELEL